MPLGATRDTLRPVHAGQNVAILMNLSRPYDRQVLRGITEFVKEAGLKWRFYVEEDPADKVPDFGQWACDGLIVDTDDGRLFRAVRGLSVPLVGIGRFGREPRPNRRTRTVGPDDAMIGRWAADHLVECGLRHFAYCGIRQRGPDPWSEVRFAGFRRRLSDLGFPCLRYTGRHVSARHWSRLQREVAGWLDSVPKPIGIMACNDWRARHVLENARQLRLRVPEDVAVIGVDNDELTCEMADPPLSSIAPATREIGYRAARVLYRLMSRRAGRVDDVLVPPSELVRRQSTDLLAIRDPQIHRALLYLRERAGESIGAPEVAKAAGASRAALDQRFKRALGRTVAEQLRRVRTEIAWDLLLSTRLPLHDVARRSGFRTAQYLCYVFRRDAGRSPADVRAHRGLAANRLSLGPPRHLGGYGAREVSP